MNRITKNCSRTKNPICIFIGGQPGCGKSTISRKIRTQNTTNGFVDISLDNYRSYHPNYLKIENCIKKHWEVKQETENDTKGNDIADFTNNFASIISDEILDEASRNIDSKAYNIALEWGMRTPEAPLKRLKDLKNKGYTNIIDFILVHKDISKEACKIRADVMNNFSHIIRRVPDYFHSLCIETLPSSAKAIYETGYKLDKTIDKIMCTSRENRIIWDQTSSEDIEKIYQEYLNNKELSTGYINNEDLAITSYSEEKRGFTSEIDEMFNTKQNDNKDENYNSTKKSII